MFVRPTHPLGPLYCLANKSDLPPLVVFVGIAEEAFILSFFSHSLRSLLDTDAISKRGDFELRSIKASQLFVLPFNSFLLLFFSLVKILIYSPFLNQRSLLV